MTKFATRLIRDGKVKFYNKYYQVEPAKRHEPYKDDPPYDGRLDGQRGVFYKYDERMAPALKDYIYLHSFENTPWPGSNCIDGIFIWERWKEVK